METDEKMDFQSHAALFSWLSESNNVSRLVAGLRYVSKDDKRRLRSSCWDNMDGIWGQMAQRLFEENSELQRFFIYTVWRDNKMDVQDLFMEACGKKQRKKEIVPNEVEGMAFCICEKRYEEGVDPIMVQCLNCENWFHHICIGIPSSPVEEDFICQFCVNQTPKPLNQQILTEDLHNFSFVSYIDGDSDHLKESDESIHDNHQIDDLDSDVEVPEIPDDPEEMDALKDLHQHAEKLRAMEEKIFDQKSIPKVFSDDSDEEQKSVDPKSGEPSASEEESNPEVKNSEFVEPEVSKTFGIIIPSKEWNKFCVPVKKTLKLKATKSTAEKTVDVQTYSLELGYTDMLFKYFNLQNPYCLLKSDAKKIRNDTELEKGGAQIRVYMLCTREGCTAHYSFSCIKCPPIGHDAVLTVSLTSGTVKHTNRKENASRQLRGKTREKVKKKLATTKPHTVQKEQLASASIEGLKSGNYALVQSLQTLQKARSEKMHEDDMSQDPLVDLICTKQKLDETIKGRRIHGYVQSLSLFPFAMQLYTEKSFQILHQMTNLQSDLVIFLDATDKIFSGLPLPLDNKRPMLYSVVIESLKDSADFPIYEFATTSHTFASVSGHLMHFFESYKRFYNESSQFYGVRRAEIDFSKTLLASLVFVFNKSDTTEYFLQLWRAMLGFHDRKITEKIFPIHVCRIHVSRFLKLAYLKHYKSALQKKEIVATLVKWSYGLMYAKDLFSMARRMTDILMITGVMYYTDEVAQTIEDISKPTPRTDFKPWNFFSFEEKSMFAPFWKRSPFGQFGSALSDQVEFYNNFHTATNGKHLRPSERGQNPYFSLDLSHYMKVHIFPYYPILTRTVFDIFNMAIKDDTTNRAENVFKLLKHNVHANDLKQRCGKFVRNQSVWIEGSAKDFLASFPDSAAEKDVKDDSKKKSKRTKHRPKNPDRLSPEQFKETFKRNSQSQSSKIGSIYLTSPFLRWGGQFDHEGIQYDVDNSCNVDNVIYILFLLYNHNPAVKRYIDQWKDVGDLNTLAVLDVLSKISESNFGEAKRIWITKLLSWRFTRKTVNLLGEERENGFNPIKHWMRMLRTKTCSEIACKAYRTEEYDFNWDSEEELPLDTDVRSVHQYYMVRSSELIKVINNEEPSLVPRDNICDFCRQKSVTKFHFPGGPPPLFFFPLQGVEAGVFGVDHLADKEENLPTTMKIHGYDYDVVAYSMHTAMLGPKHGQAAQHILAVLVDGKEKFCYDGLQTSLKPHKNAFVFPIISVWLVRR